MCIDQLLCPRRQLSAAVRYSEEQRLMGVIVRALRDADGRIRLSNIAR
jgi:hypothetical protein